MKTLDKLTIGIDHLLTRSKAQGTAGQFSDD